MHAQIHKVLEEVWQHHSQSLLHGIDDSVRELNNLLRLDDHHRHGHEEERLREAMGPLGNTNLNLVSLSQVLSKSAGQRSMTEARHKRVENLLNSLESTRKIVAGFSPPYPCSNFDEAEDEIHMKAEAHLNAMADIFRDLRIAQLEIHSKYRAEIHDAQFTEFNWRRLSPGELKSCPPFTVFAELDSDSGSQLRKMMALLESRKPIKIAVRRVSLKKAYSPTADPSVPARMALEMLPLAMRGVYFLQVCSAVPDFKDRLSKAFCSPRPALISYLGKREDEDLKDFHARTRRAMRSRTFPAIMYDPDLAPGFVGCFDLSANPSPERAWLTEEETPQQEGMDSAAYTFAHYALHEPAFAADFTNPQDDLHPEAIVPIDEFLELNRRQRIGKIPVVFTLDKEGNNKAKVVSHAVVTQTSDQFHLWKSLQEISGVDNPFVNTTRRVLNEEFGAQQKALLKSLQDEMEKNQAHREQVAVANAVRQMVSHLTGVDPQEIDLGNIVTDSETSTD